MVCNITYVTLGAKMARGGSGRIVLEVDPALKRRLYAALAIEEKSLKEWFVRSAQTFLDERQQPNLFEPHSVKSAQRGAAK